MRREPESPGSRLQSTAKGNQQLAALRISSQIACLLLFAQHALAQTWMPVDWPMLVDQQAQQFEDPYRDLTPSQFQSLMALAQLRIALGEASPEGKRADMEERASKLSKDLRAQGLDPDWILAQREAVAERRQHAALATNDALEGKHVELSGYLLVAPDVEEGAMVAFLLPDRGVCMHLPPPTPNQLIRLKIDELPKPLGPCITSAVRGQLSAEETKAVVPVIDDNVSFWSRWKLEVSEVITSGTFSTEN